MTLQSLTLTLFALAAGAMIALQAPINAEAASRLGHPLAAATMSFCVGSLALIVLTFVFANQSTHLGALKHLPLYMLLGGGLLGAFYVTMALILAPRIGIAAVMALGIAGQLVAALAREDAAADTAAITGARLDRPAADGCGIRDAKRAAHDGRHLRSEGCLACGAEELRTQGESFLDRGRELCLSLEVSRGRARLEIMTRAKVD